MVCGRVTKFGSGICLSGELVPEFNYFLKVSSFQIFKYVRIGSRQSCTVRLTSIYHPVPEN